MLKKNKIVNSLESINHQIDRVIFNMLTEAFAQLKNGYADVNVTTKRVLDITKPMGIKLGVRIVSEVNIPTAMVQTPDINGAHALIHDGRKAFTKHGKSSYTDDLWGDLVEQLADIDRAKCKLGGFYSKIPFEVYLSGGLFTHLEPAQIAATFLHEVGHAWSYCEMLTYNAYVNQAMKTATDAYRGQDSSEKMRILKVAGMESTNLERVDDLDEENYVRLVTVATSKRLGHLLKESDRTWYDRSSFEYLADQFTARLGGAKDLMMALEVMNDYVGYNAYYESKIASFTVSVMKVCAAITLSVPTLIMSVMYGDPRERNDELGKGTYDTDKDRYIRIMHQVRDLLKDRSIPKDLRKKTLEDLKYLETAIGKMHESIKISNLLWYVVSPSYRRSKGTKLEQQMLEELANNSLYGRAAELADLSQN